MTRRPRRHRSRKYFDHWFERVDQTQAEQPHWMTPIATTTPRLEEELRYDQFFQKLGNGGTLDNVDGGKGLELIPAEPVEVIFGLPPYIEKSTPGKPSVDGFNDLPFLLIKYRLLSANEQSGNYIVTAFLQGSAPTGIEALLPRTLIRSRRRSREVSASAISTFRPRSASAYRQTTRRTPAIR